MIWFNIGVVLTVVLQFINFWLISKGKINYYVMIATYIGYLILETILALKEEDQYMVLVFNLVNVWALSMTVKGLLRQRKEQGR